jgi:hypothetical protein
LVNGKSVRKHADQLRYRHRANDVINPADDVANDEPEVPVPLLLASHQEVPATVVPLPSTQAASSSVLIVPETGPETVPESVPKTRAAQAAPRSNDCVTDAVASPVQQTLRRSQRIRKRPVPIYNPA